MRPNEQITNDLMSKVSRDVQHAIRRTLAIAPEPMLPIATSAGATAIAVMGGILEHMAGTRVEGAAPDPECVFLAALLCARMALNPDNGISLAYQDLEIMKARIALSSAK